jgi:hypothetical protein
MPAFAGMTVDGRWVKTQGDWCKLFADDHV